MSDKFALINQVNMGQRVIGFELYNCNDCEVFGASERMIKNTLKSGGVVLGFELGALGELFLDGEFLKNLMIKKGMSNLTPIKINDGLTLMYTVIGKVGDEFEAVSSRFWHGNISEEKIKTLYERGAVNGVKLDSEGKVQLIERKGEIFKEIMNFEEVYNNVKNGEDTVRSVCKRNHITVYDWQKRVQKYEDSLAAEAASHDADTVDEK